MTAGLAPCLGGVAQSGQRRCKPPQPATSVPRPRGDRGWAPAAVHPCPFTPSFPCWAWRKDLQLLPIAVMVLHEVRHPSAVAGNEPTASLGHQAAGQWWLLSITANLACFCIAMALQLPYCHKLLSSQEEVRDLHKALDGPTGTFVLLNPDKYIWLVGSNVA